MAAHAHLSVTPDLPDHSGPGSSLADLSLDELRFLRSCDKRWFKLSPAEASVIIRAARKLIVDLVGEYGADLACINLGDSPAERQERMAG